MSDKVIRNITKEAIFEINELIKTEFNLNSSDRNYIVKKISKIFLEFKDNLLFIYK